MQKGILSSKRLFELPLTEILGEHISCDAPLLGGRTRWRRIYFQPNTALPIGVADEAVNHSRRHTPIGSENAKA